MQEVFPNFGEGERVSIHSKLHSSVTEGVILERSEEVIPSRGRRYLVKVADAEVSVFAEDLEPIPVLRLDWITSWAKMWAEGQGKKVIPWKLMQQKIQSEIERAPERHREQEIRMAVVRGVLAARPDSARLGGWPPEALAGLDVPPEQQVE